MLNPSEKRVLLTCFGCYPDDSMETRLSWNRARQAARHHETWLVYGDHHEPSQLACRLAQENPELVERLHFVHVKRNAREESLCVSEHFFYWGYRAWHTRLLTLVQKMHAEHAFDLIHHVSFVATENRANVGKSILPLSSVRSVVPITIHCGF